MPDDLHRRPDRVGGGVHGPGHEPVDVSLPQHHRADHDRVDEGVAGDVLGDALVLAQLHQRRHELLGHRRRVDDLDGGGQRQPHPVGGVVDLVGVAEQDAAADAALGAPDGGLQRPGLRALGEHDAFVRRARHLDELMAERGRAQPPRVVGGGQCLQERLVERVRDVAHHQVGAVAVVGGHLGFQVVQAHRCFVGEVVDDEEGQPGLPGLAGEVPDRRVGFHADREQDAGQLHPVERGEAAGEEDVVPVAGDEDELALANPAQGAGDGLGADGDALDPPLHVAFVQDAGADRPADVGHPRPGEARPRYGTAPTRVRWWPSSADLSRFSASGSSRGHAVDHASDDANLLADPVLVAGDGEGLRDVLGLVVAGAS